MKLKDRPLEWWKGRSFAYWCRADRNDTRKIHYTLNHRSIGQGLRVYTFTSDDKIDFSLFWDVQHSTIYKIELNNNEWYVELDAGIVPAERYA